MPSIFDEIEAAADLYTMDFRPGADTPAPRRHLAVVACMDARLDLFRLLGLDIGDAHLLRNAGGLVTDDVLRSLVLSQRALGTRTTVLVHHTDCGLQKIDDTTFVDELERDTGRRPDWLPGAFADPYDDVQRSLALLRACPWLVSTRSAGYVFDVGDGRLVAVE